MEAYFIDQTPLRVKKPQHPIQLFTENTPNGKRVQILLEELHEAVDLDFETQLIDLEADEQKKDWFLALNPAGRIPVLIDNSIPGGPISIMESAAILLYLQENHDANNFFGFSSAHERSQVQQWLFMWHSAARLHGLTRAFMNDGSSDSTTAGRLRQRMLPIYTLIEDHLSGKYRSSGGGREYLAGDGQGKYSIADIGAWPHVRSWKGLGLTENEMHQFPCLLAWIERIEARPAVQRGISDEYYSSEVNPALVAKSL
ncbi:hypothetical protein NLG97_g11014 [Lecanicillium saksenae]|uniref:Uncharacterized protein n=1 Tax=Lecanicillium saksenae TaxID=468837 RepID=A0ACC1QEQ6_9HYPO|nr:hypothetical protein NLG97_g11014 [Lecanicillium saksenae]